MAIQYASILLTIDSWKKARVQFLRNYYQLVVNHSAKIFYEIRQEISRTIFVQFV